MKYFVTVVIVCVIIVGAWFICGMDDSDKDSFEYKNVWIVQMKDNEMICVLGKDLDKKSKREDSSNSVYKKYKLASDAGKMYTHVMADIVVVDNVVTKVTLKPSMIKGSLVAIDEENKCVEVDRYGKVKLTNDFKVYEVECDKDRNVNDINEDIEGIYNDNNEEISIDIRHIGSNIKGLNIGLENVTYVVEKDKICGVIINGCLLDDLNNRDNNNVVKDNEKDKFNINFNTEKNDNSKQVGTYIKVLLKNSNYSSIFHNEVSLKSKDNLEIFYVDDAKEVSVNNSKKVGKDKLEIYESEESDLKKKNYVRNKIKEGKLVKISSKSRYFNNYDRIIIVNESDILDEQKDADKNIGKDITEDINDKGIIIPSIKRSVKGIKYKGYLEIIKTKQGLIVINTLDIEDYLYSVVPSEMPESYPIEALKAQAICARTYAMNKIKSSGYKKYGAHLDDSISYQVYNNMKYGKNSIRAVDETKGQIITYKDGPASVYYYSTSSGYSSTTKDVFGGEKLVYLPSKKQVLSTDGDAFERNCEWFKWKTSINGDKLSRSINDNIYRMNKAGGLTNVKVYNKKYKKYIKGPVSNIGNLKSIKVKERGSGGIVTKIIIKGTKNSICVEKQYTIRQMLAVSNQTIVKNNGKKIKGMTALPSGFFKIKKKGNNYIISGGGYGHGVGMSQCGASELAKRGIGYREIIEFYFEGVEIR